MTDFLFGWLHTPMIERTALDGIVMYLEIVAVCGLIRYGIIPAILAICERKEGKK